MHYEAFLFFSDTAQGWWEHMWVTLITPKVNTYVFV